MKSALVILGSFAMVYAGSAWFATVMDDERQFRELGTAGGWITVSPPTIRQTYLQPQRPSPAELDLRFALVECQPAAKSAAEWEERFPAD